MRPNQSMKPTASDRMTDSVLAIAPLPWLICVSLDREHVTSAHTLFPDTRVVLGFVCFWALADAIRGLSADSGRADRMFHILHCRHCDFIGIAIFACVVDVLSSVRPCSISRAHVRPRLHRRRRARLLSALDRPLDYRRRLIRICVTLYSLSSGNPGGEPRPGSS